MSTTSSRKLRWRHRCSRGREGAKEEALMIWMSWRMMRMRMKVMKKMKKRKTRKMITMRKIMIIIWEAKA